MSKKNGKQAPAFSNSEHALIDLRQVTKTYQGAAGSFTALKGVDLQIARGEFVAIIGKSGSGKTTLLNMITGIDRATAGAVTIAGTAVHELNEDMIAVWRGKTVGVVFQFFQLLPTLTVVENVMLPMDFCNTYPTRQRKIRALELLERVGVADQANKLPATLSGGQQQRVAIARALANDPPFIVADEPTGNLDTQTSDMVLALFTTLINEDKTVLIVTHERDISARVTRTVTLIDGRIAEDRSKKPAETIKEGIYA
ncbi:MAG TPA: ABC transporter ATP-binding protein [Aggregatilineaceae bacterium]|nr:ABC transporter ATP-binding protein [Aggregatilineaceae bacterium]